MTRRTFAALPLALAAPQSEDAQDLAELEAAIRANAGKPLIPWDTVKKELDI